jgi:hypothetical protein
VIDFDLAAAHPAYRDVIVETYEGFLRDWPMTQLRRVIVYPPEHAKNCRTCINRSLGDATEPYTIRLNGYWLGQDPEVLRAAGEVDDYVPGYPSLRWHGGMPQPYQVLYHEAAHVLRDGLGPETEALSCAMWLEAMVDPGQAPTGYACYNDSEWFAEAFACLALGCAGDNVQVLELKRFLADVR